MNDRFKFRAWDSKGKTYWDGKPYYWKPQMIYDIDTTSWWGWAKEELIIMQCTGLKDKNGELIWEGDIVKLSECQLEKVIFEDGIFGIKCYVGSGDWITEPVWITEPLKEFDHVEVIGNIFENPELLNERSET